MPRDEAQALISQIRNGRRQWVELQPGKRLRFSRPPETSLNEFLQVRSDNVPQLFAGLKQVQQYADGWEGITHADLVGSEVGSDMAAEFTPELWAEVIADRRDWLQRAARGLIDAINAHETAKAETTKN